MAFTQPDYDQGLGVVVVVHFGITAALLTLVL